jgi:hypothetical protein
MKNKNCHKKRTAHCWIITSLLLNPLIQRLVNVTPFRLSKQLYSRSVLFQRTNNFGSVFTNRLDRRIYKTKFPIHVSFGFFSPPFSISLISNFSSTLKTFAGECSHVITLQDSWELQE